MTKQFQLIFSFFIFLSSIQASNNQYPSVLLQMDSFFSHHVIIAEKSTHQLYLYENNNGLPNLVKIYQMATGKKSGDKLFQGDHRTPEGIYFLVDFLTHQDLLKRHGEQGKIYGVGAFVLDYPNPIDAKEGKTGGGIWLHSTNDETRIEKGLDSRGCIVTANNHLIDISKYIELHRTPMIVVHDLTYLNEEAWKTKKEKINSTLQTWLTAWQTENFNEYINSYHKNFFDPRKGGLSSYSLYKKAVFNNPGRPEISLTDTSIIQVGDYAVATFKQNYQSETIKDLGKKTLYLKRDDFYQWKIVGEYWTKSGVEEVTETPTPVAFRPSMRFFTSQNPVTILGDSLIHLNDSGSKSENN